jgi:UDP-glucose:(heptosyl)LPS alpha-1,3-glucosyltransferase
LAAGVRFAFGIFRLEPAGGLERNALEIAELLLARGHRIAIHATSGSDATPAGVETVLLRKRGRSNHGAMKAFSADFAAAARGFDMVVGFQKLEGLDLLYCADWCFVDRPRSSWQRLLPRYRIMAALERACFAGQSATRIIALAAPQLEAYRRAYGTPAARTALIPPTLAPAIRAEAPPAAEQRAAFKAKLGIGADAVVWLWVGLQPLVKGLDRVLAALSRRADAVLVICGATRGNRQLDGLLDRAEYASLAQRIRFLGMVNDSHSLSDVYAGADLLVHPARLDVTGSVILEAIVNGLPVVATGNCGYSPHVAAADAGIVLAGAFDQRAFEGALADADAKRRASWSANAFAYGLSPGLFTGLPRAADLIEAAARKDDAAWRVLGQNGRPVAPRSPA